MNGIVSYIHPNEAQTSPAVKKTFVKGTLPDQTKIKCSAGRKQVFNKLEN
jgi:hypothetical protein